MNYRNNYRRRLKRTSTKAPKVESAATLARREKRLANLLRRLRDLQCDAEFLANERANKDRRREILRERYEKESELRDAADQVKRDARDKAMEEISAIYRRESNQFVDRRPWWEKLTTVIPDFKYSELSLMFAPQEHAEGTRRRNFYPTGDDSNYGTSFGRFFQTEATWRKVVAIEDGYIETCTRIEEDFDREKGKIWTEVELATLAPHKMGHKTIDQIPEVEAALKKCRSQLAEAKRDEQSLREIYRVDDQTIAQAAAHTEQTRTLADKIKPEIRNQFQVSNNCPYCEEELTDKQHADHIYPVSRGGLSTPDNLVFVCDRCNLAKHDMTIREFCVKFELDRNAIESRLLHLGKRI